MIIVFIIMNNVVQIKRL